MKKEPITREGKKAKVREAIVKAAIDLFEQKGFERTTVDEIAATAEISSRTFFRYFLSKDHVVFPFHAEYIAKFRERLREFHNDVSPMAALKQALWMMAEDYQSQRHEHLRYQRIISASTDLLARTIIFDQEWEVAIYDALHAKLHDSGKDDRYIRLVAGMIMGAIAAVMREWYGGDCLGCLPEMGRKALELVESGIGTDSP